MKKKTSKKFIQFIDEYASDIKNNTVDYYYITSLINNNYIQNQLYDPSFVGYLSNQVLYYYPKNNDNYSFTNDNSQNYYSYYSNSFWNNSIQEDNNYNLYYNVMNNKGLNENEIQDFIKKQEQNKQNEQYDKKEKKQEIVKTKFLHIDASMNTLIDLIKIIENNEYKIDTEYNIDLKSLHNIKNELIELNNMIGIQGMKQSIVEQLIYFVQELHIGINISEFKHTIIYGPPGTGKTEIAKIIGKMYSKLGILKNNTFKKVTRNDLVAGYLGQTAIKTKKVITESLGGVLFIDEAYSLASRDDNDTFSKECIDILCESLSDHKDELMVIIAGYEEELNETIFRVNKGLETRFIWRFKMEPYNSSELMKIFKKKVYEQEWSIENENEIKERWFEEKKDKFKGYGRDMELLLVYTKISHGKRIYGKSKEMRKKISIEDLNQGYKSFLTNKNSKNNENKYINSLYI
jgi:SpoVK/Ycf46/Vps4 family AAA+-type ATPase